MKFVKPLSEEIRQQLHKIYTSHSIFKTRQRAQAVLLSSRGYTLIDLQQILQVDRDTLSTWFNRFENLGISGLDDLPRSGRPPIYTETEMETFKALIDDEPRQIKQAQAKLQQLTGKASCTETLKRSLKKN